MEDSVIGKAKRNIIAGLLNRLVLMLCPFVERAVIQGILGAQYLGLGSLYTAVISTLSLTELGFSSAMVYNMYRPAAERNTEKINALLNYYKNAYRVIGCAVILLGLCVIPFLNVLIRGEYPQEIHLTGLYLLYLANTSVSYFLFAYMNSLLVVFQRNDVQSSVNSIVRLSLTISQALTLIVTRNYYCFAALAPIFTALGNVWTAWRVHTLYPHYKPEGRLSGDEKRGILKLVSGTFLQQACGVTRNSLDSVCISAFLGLTLTAIYSNYYVVFAGVTSILSIVSSSFAGGVGIHVAVRPVEENYEELKKLDFVYLFVSGWCAVCLLCLYQPFMRLWMGFEMMLSQSSVFLLCAYFYLLKLGDMRSLYASANGMWWKMRYRALLETFLNFALNIVLAKFFGVQGVIAATIISLFFCNYIWSTLILFRSYFSVSRLPDYFFRHIRYTLPNILAAVLTFHVCAALNLPNPVLDLLVKAALCCVVPAPIYAFYLTRSPYYDYLKSLVACKFRI